MDDEKMDATDVAFYVNEINALLDEEKEINLDENTITPDIADNLAKSLEDIYFKLKDKKDKEFEEKMKKQRYERGYADSDVWNINYWFIRTLKPMLKQLRDTHMGSPACLDIEDDNPDDCHQKWNEILDRMIFLLQEMDEDTCSFKNVYEDDVMKSYDDFWGKYGTFGDGLKTEEELAKEKEQGNSRMLFPSDEPGRDDVKELFEKYYDIEKEIFDYREECKNEFFELFSKYFWALWD